MMTTISKDEEVLETAIAGLSRVAHAIASMPADDRPRALDAAERSYCETAVGGRLHARLWSGAPEIPTCPGSAITEKALYERPGGRQEGARYFMDYSGRR
jgi:hypothetical protein